MYKNIISNKQNICKYSCNFTVSPLKPSSKEKFENCYIPLGYQVIYEVSLVLWTVM